MQAIKAGILEIADILVVSKGDLPAAETTVRDLEEMLRLRRAGAIPVPVLKTTATRGEGVAAVVDAVLAHAARVGRGRRFAAHGAPSTDDIAAVDRAITTRRSVRRFLPDPVSARDRRGHPRRREPRTERNEHAAVARPRPRRRNRRTRFRPRSCTRTTTSTPHTSRSTATIRRSGTSRISRGGGGSAGTSTGFSASGVPTRQAMHRQHGRNYLFFDAPVGLIFTIDRGLERGSWLDYGMFLQNVMVAARARGLDTCPQVSFLKFHRVVARELALASERDRRVRDVARSRRSGRAREPARYGTRARRGVRPVPRIRDPRTRAGGTPRRRRAAGRAAPVDGRRRRVTAGRATPPRSYRRANHEETATMDHKTQAAERANELGSRDPLAHAHWASAAPMPGRDGRS